MKTELTNDLMFSCIFRDMGAAQAMLSLVNAIRADKGRLPLREIVALESQYNLIGKFVNSKMGRLDVLAIAEDGRQINIEMQVKPDKNIGMRLSFYSSMLHAEIESGDGYETLPPQSMIVIEGSKHRVNPDGQYHKTYNMRNDLPPHEALEGFPEVHRLSLPTFEKTARLDKPDKNNMLGVWLTIFSRGHEDSQFLEEAKKMDAGILQFAERYNLALDDPDFKRKYYYFRSAEMEHNSRVYTAKREGREIGLTEGRAEGAASMRIKTAVSLLSKQFTPDEIAALVPDITDEELLEAQREING